MSYSDILRASLVAPKRFCPLLPCSVIIKGSRLILYLPDQKIVISTSPKYLSKLIDWCRGEKSLSEIEELANNEFGNTEFMEFVADLIDATVLVDGAQHLAGVAVNSLSLGKRTEEVIWRDLALKRNLRSEESDTSAYHLIPSKELSFLRTLEKRHSATRFINGDFPLSYLIQLLHAAYGRMENGHRSVASAGGFYSLDISLGLLRDIGHVVAGVYDVLFFEDGSIRLKKTERSLDFIPRLIPYPALLRNAAGLVMVGADLRPVAMKYRNLSYPYVLLEAGSVIQNIALSAAELGVGWRSLGITEKRYVEQYLSMNTPYQQALIAGVFGMISVGEEVSDSEPDIEFGWEDQLKDLPFTMAMARIKDVTSTKQLAFSWGRASSPKLAYDKAVAEAAERYAYHQPRKCIEAKWGDLSNMYDPHLLNGYARHQYRRKHFPFAAFCRECSYLWTEAINLLDGKVWWIPAEYVFARSTLPEKYREKPLAAATSSGCASGISVHAAQSAALFEVIERDSFMQHWFAQHGGKKVPIATLPVNLKGRIQNLQKKGCHVTLHLLELGIMPVWMFFAQDEDVGFTAVSAGTSLDAVTALESALMEVETAVYSRWAVPVTRISPASVNEPSQHADLYAQKRYFRRANAINRETGRITFDDAISLFPSSLERIYQRLQVIDTPVLWIDLSLQNAPHSLDGERIFSGRILVPKLTPMCFGAGNIPLGRDKYGHRCARFPHPFP